MACASQPRLFWTAEIWQAKAEVVHLNEQQVGRGRALTLPWPASRPSPTVPCLWF